MPFIPPMLATRLEDPRRLADPRYSAGCHPRAADDQPHSMRHSFATWALEGNEEKGVAPTPILAVRDWMGHASVQETEGYLHRSKTSHSEAVANLDAYVTA